MGDNEHRIPVEILDDDADNFNTKDNKNLYDEQMGENPNSRDEPLYVMTIELEKGKSEVIKIYNDSIPEELSYEFCKINNLDFTSHNFLTDQIKNLLDRLHQGSAFSLTKTPDCIEEVDEEGPQTNLSSHKTIDNNQLPQWKNVEGSAENAKKIMITNIEDEFSYNSERNVDLQTNSLNNIGTNDTEKCYKGTYDEDATRKPAPSNQNKQLFSYQLLMNNRQKLIPKTKKEAKFIKKPKEENKTQEEKTNPIVQSLLKSDIIDRLYKGNKIFIDRNLTRQGNGKGTIENNSNCFNTSNKFYETSNVIQNHSVRKFKTGEVINYGERLYYKGIKLKEETNRKIENFKKEVEENNGRIYTHKPQINNPTPEILRKRMEENMTYDNDDRILNYQGYVEEKFRRLREKHDKREQHSFSPNINRRSQQMEEMKMKSRVNSHGPRGRYQDLYEDFKQKRIKLETLADQIYGIYPYRPAITDYANAHVTNTFDERQVNYQRRVNDNLNKLRETMHHPVDEKTGQQLFQPSLMNTLSSTGRSMIRSNIFNNLYSYAQRYKMNQLDMTNSFASEIKKNSELKHTTSDSEFIFSQKKTDSFRKIFKLLDSDGDDSISILSMSFKKIPSVIIKILQPIIKELREENETLNEEEFIKACEHLYEFISYNDKRALIDFASVKKRVPRPNFPFKPAIDQNSRRLAEAKKMQISRIVGNITESEFFPNLSRATSTNKMIQKVPSHKSVN